MTFYAVCDSAGAVLFCGECPMTQEEMTDAWAVQPGQTLAFSEVALGAPQGWRLQDGELVPRAAMAVTISAPSIAADGTDAAVLSGLPDPCEITIVRQPAGADRHQAGPTVYGPATIAGGSLTVTSTEAGRLRVHVTAGVLYVPWQGVVDAG
jgi:hypothetical protein